MELAVKDSHLYTVLVIHNIALPTFQGRWLRLHGHKMKIAESN
jgi:hypothetical protein